MAMEYEMKFIFHFIPYFKKFHFLKCPRYLFWILRRCCRIYARSENDHVREFVFVFLGEIFPTSVKPLIRFVSFK